LLAEHKKCGYTSDVGVPLTDFQMADVATDTVVYFLQSVLILRGRVDRTGATADHFRALVLN